MTPTVLFAGFEPFGGEMCNPSSDAIGLLPDTIAGCRVKTVDLPVTFAAAFPALRSAVATHRPSLVLLVGQAGGRSEICLERVALNLADADRADNDGAMPADLPVVTDGPAAYFSPLPLKAMRARLAEAGIPARISDSAGTYVCNQVFYRACHDLAPTPAGLIHVPYAPAQVVNRPGTPSMAPATVAEALRIAAAAAIAGLTPLEVAPGLPAR